MLVAGAMELEKQGLLNLKIIESVENKLDSAIGVTKVVINGSVCYFDYADGYSDCIELKKSLLKEADFYFRRSYSDKYNSMLFSEFQNKIYPLGMNYYVYAQNQKILFDNRPLWKRKLRKLLRYKEDNDFTIDIFEKKADYKKTNPTVLFYTRLWGEESEDNKIDEMRINIIRALKEKYGQLFRGGVYQNNISEKICPDLIVSKKETDRYTYIHNMKNSDICIGTMGLDESIGWKTAEYIAASRAIVHEKFHFFVPGGFCKEKNYLEFSSVEECLDNVQLLMDSPDLLYNMKKANQKYYETWLRPDKQLWNALQIIINN